MPSATSSAHSVAAAVVTTAKKTLIRRGEIIGVRLSVKTGAPLHEVRRA